ncbi:MAG: recombinase family protein [Syntrophales bacterium]
MKAIGYIRVSTEDQAREGISLDNQDSKVRAYADLHGLDLVDVIRDEGISGKSLERPGFERLQGILNSGKAQAVIAYKLDRLSRKTIDILTVLENWERQGIAFHCIQDRIDTTSAAGKFLVTILSALAQMERDLISERTIDALSHKKKVGEWCGRIPFGYRIEGSRLVENPEEIETIQKIKRAYRKDRSGRRKTMRELAERFGKSRQYICKAVNTPMKTLHERYSVN